MGTQKEKRTPHSHVRSKDFLNQETRTLAPFVAKVAKLESIEILHIEIVVNQA